VAHDRGEGSNGLRAPGQYQTGGVPRARRGDRSSSCGTTTTVSTRRTAKRRW
jgi:hypothetical protein